MNNDTTESRTDLMSCDEAARYAGVTPHRIRKARAAGDLVGHLPRGSKRGWRYLKSDLDVWLLGEASV